MKKDDELVGTAIKTYTKNGFGGLVWLMVGFKTDGAINDISVLEQNETPGLGTKMTTAKFKNQFNDKNPEQYKLSVTKDGGDVDAITAATISSRAFCDAVNRAHKSFKNKGGNK
jgi:electron transport complex protein RnfG